MFRRCFVAYSDKILCQDFPHARLVTMNKPKTLNALDMDMIEDLLTVYQRKHTDPSAVYILKGAGDKGFCAGGDVVSVTTDKTNTVGRSFFYREYQFNYHLMQMKAAHVSLWNGFVMGGGVGVSLPGRYRVTTERATFAMPETAIGMIPDVGATWFLPRMNSPALGLYLGLTGQRVKGSDLVHAGLGTHYVPSEKLPELEKALCTVEDANKVEEVLDGFATSLPPFSLQEHLPFIEQHFTVNEHTTAAQIVEAMKTAGDDNKIAKGALKSMSAFSPTAMELSVELFRRGAKLTDPKDAFHLEYLVDMHLCKPGSDFIEGVRALLVDKDKSPKWNPKTLKEVSPEYIASFFTPVSADQVVWHPTKNRVA
ncbi:Enoyl-CoA hydratase/isomerase, putative [Angomonas deanei]|uniref:3-hydroxyisobutyryl-CoA hydrolase n=1 Tax=Angomonas deanei TaxID=59799 RepID=A0A7G2CCX5_9TRYP|nr:Enoyl-CoA hydratase/isomerase, putative [Angomonas deanei]